MLLQRSLRTNLFKLFCSTLTPNPIPMSSSIFVRPAILECCNIPLKQFPIITDGINSPMCLVGVNILNFLPHLIKRNFMTVSRDDKWPITLISSGPTYEMKTTLEQSHFSQCNQMAILTLARNKHECYQALEKIYSLFNEILHTFLDDTLTNINFVSVNPTNLQLWERSAIIAQFKRDGHIIIPELARFSNIGDYVSKRALITFGQTKTECDGEMVTDKTQFVHMAFSSLNLNGFTESIMLNNQIQ